MSPSTRRFAPHPAVFQSIFMVVLMTLMLRAFLQGRKLYGPHSPPTIRTVTTFLTSISSHLQRTLLTLLLIIFLMDAYLIHPPDITPPNVLVACSLALETLPPLVQLQSIRSSGSTSGVDPLVPLSWLLGDLTRCAIFAKGGDGMFSVGAAVCVFIDVAVVGMVGVPKWGKGKKHHT